MTMKAIVYDRYGTPDELRLDELPTPQPTANQVRIRIHATALNDWDWGHLNGVPFANRVDNGFKRPKKIRILGCDVAGVVDEIGASVTKFKPGDRVYGDLCMDGFGGFAEYVCAPETSLAPMPESMSFVDAAALPQAGMLAMQGLFDPGQMQAGQSLLINGGGGGVGTIGAQVAKLDGIELTGVDSEDKFETMRAAGFDHVLDYRQTDFTQKGPRYDRVIDNKLQRGFRACLRALAPGGVYAVAGGDTWRIMTIFLFGALIRLLTGKTLRVIILKPNRDLDKINALYESGKLKPVIDKVYPLADTAEAFRYYGAGKHKGKVVVSVVPER